MARRTDRSQQVDVALTPPEVHEPRVGHSIEYSNYMTSKEWRDACKKALEVHGERCLWCGAPYQQMHHRRYTRLAQENYVNDLAPVCVSCHAHPADTERIIESAARSWRSRVQLWAKAGRAKWMVARPQYRVFREELAVWARSRGDLTIPPLEVRRISDEVNPLDLNNDGVHRQITRLTQELHQSAFRAMYIAHLATVFEPGRKAKLPKKELPAADWTCRNCTKLRETERPLCFHCERIVGE